MAGSRRTFVYVDGDENAYAVVLDEDVGNNQLFGFEPYTGTPVLDPPPQGFRMRYINAFFGVAPYPRPPLPPPARRGFRMRYINAVRTAGGGAGFRFRKFAGG